MPISDAFERLIGLVKPLIDHTLPLRGSKDLDRAQGGKIVEISPSAG
jgi:hypothetical protein